MRQQSTRILDMLVTIQNSAPSYTATSVMNQFMRQQTNQSNTKSTNPVANSTNKEATNLEQLINQLA